MTRKLKGLLWKILGIFLAKNHTPSNAPFSPDKITSILAIRPDRLGDVILSTPVYASIKKSFPNIKLTVLVKRGQQEILLENPYIDRVIVFDPKNILKTLRVLCSESYDIAIVLNLVFSSTAAFIALLSRAPWKAGYDTPEGKQIFNLLVPKKNKLLHETQHNLDVLRFLQFPVIEESPKLFIEEKVKKEVESLIAEKVRFPEKPLVLVKPGTRVLKWGWKTDNFKEAIKQLVDSEDAEVFIIQGPGEEDLISNFAEPSNSYVTILPPLTIAQLAYLIQRSKLLICNHTGIMHLASAVQTPALTIFKHGEIDRWGPICNRHIVLEERNDDNLSPQTVVENIRRLLFDSNNTAETY
jgi:ADP-heptose:LPS heptosyltransferase